MTSDPYRFTKFQQPIVQNPPSTGYRQGLPTNTQNISQAAKKQSYPQRLASHPSSNPVGASEGSRAELTLTQAFDRLAIVTPPYTNRNINVVLFGEPGVGKSGVVNLVARKILASVPSGAHSFTLQSTRYDVSIDDMKISIFETAGLEEPEIRANNYLVVLEKAYEFVQKLDAACGVHLLLFCIRADSLTATTQSNFRLFSEVVFQSEVPIALVVTGLEGEREMEDWWTRNKTLVERYGFKSDGHACITTVTNGSSRQDYNYSESYKRIRELLKSSCLRTSPFLPEPQDWFLRLGNGMQQFVDKHQKPTRGEVMNTLTMRLKLDSRMVQGFLAMMEQGDKQPSSRVGEDRPRGAPSARANYQDWEGEVDPSRSNATPRSRDLDAGKRSHEPQRAGSMENAQPSDTLDPGRRDDGPSRRRTAGELPITQSQARYLGAAEQEHKGGRWDDEARRREMSAGTVKVGSRKANTPTESFYKNEMDVSMEDIRLNFPHDLTGHVTRSNRYPFASGSFGDVYRGKFTMRGKSTAVAIKVYKVYPQRDEHLDDRMKRFHTEIIVWLKLQHPNVLPLFGTIRDADMHPNIPAMVCPWVENGALTGYLDRNKDLPVTERLILVNDVAHGLQYLHSQHVIHGDLSGSNVLVRADARACIADFGLSTLLTAVSGRAMVTSRQNKGTVRWMAPELLDPQNAYPPGPTTRSDVYSFGSVMLQTLTGNIPYHHLLRDEQVIWTLLKGTRPDRPAQRAVTSGRWEFIERCWSSGGGRPSSDEIVGFTKRELTESIAGRI